MHSYSVCWIILKLDITATWQISVALLVLNSILGILGFSVDSTSGRFLACTAAVTQRRALPGSLSTMSTKRHRAPQRETSFEPLPPSRCVFVSHQQEFMRWETECISTCIDRATPRSAHTKTIQCLRLKPFRAEKCTLLLITLNQSDESLLRLSWHNFFNSNYITLIYLHIGVLIRSFLLKSISIFFLVNISKQNNCYADVCNLMRWQFWK